MYNFKQINCFSRNLSFWKLLGIYPLGVSWPIFYSIYSKAFIFFFIVMYNVLFSINLYFLPKRLDDYIEELIFYFTLLAIMCRVFTFIFKRNKIIDILNLLESDTFQPESKRAIEIINDAERFNKQYWKIYATVCATSNLVHVLSPLLAHFIFNVELFLPVCSYVFLSDEIRNHFIYPLYFYESVGMHFHMLSFVNIDTFVIGLMVLLIAQLNIVEDKLTNITEEFKRNARQNDKALISKLNKSLIHYDRISSFRNLIEDVFSVTLFVQFGVASCVICICLFRYTMNASWQYYIFLATYTIAMIVQIIVPCWFGTRIMDKSCQLSQAIYNCDWTPRSQRFKNSMRLFVERANRPLSITGWKMFPLSLTTFTSIMNSAYSFFTLLQHMKSR